MSLACGWEGSASLHHHHRALCALCISFSAGLLCSTIHHRLISNLSAIYCNFCSLCFAPTTTTSAVCDRRNTVDCVPTTTTSAARKRGSTDDRQRRHKHIHTTQTRHHTHAHVPHNHHNFHMMHDQAMMAKMANQLQIMMQSQACMNTSSPPPFPTMSPSC